MEGVPQPDKKRQQLSDILGISINPARCATHLKQNLTNPEMDSDLKNLKKSLKEATDVNEISRIKLDISKISNQIIRISTETSSIIASICNGIVEELLKHGINEACKINKKKVDVNNIISGDHSKNLYYSVYYKLAPFKTYKPEQYEHLKKKKEVKKKVKEGSEDVEVKEDVEAEESVEDIDNIAVVRVDKKDFTFDSYINTILKNIRKDPEYENIRIRTDRDIKTFLSNIIIECIKRVVSFSKIIFNNVTKIRTMNSLHVKAIIHLIMKDEGIADEDIDKVLLYIDGKIKTYQDHIKNEKENKFNNLTADDKKKIDDKKIESQKNKKQKDMENAEKKSKEAQEKYKKLVKEMKTKT